MTDLFHHDHVQTSRTDRPSAPSDRWRPSAPPEPAPPTLTLARESGPGPTSRSQQLGASASHLHDLSYATALVGSAERLHAFEGLADLVLALPAEATALVAADGAAVLGHGRRGWTSLVAPPSLLSTDPTYAESLALRAARAGLLEPGYVPDLDRAPQWSLSGDAGGGTDVPGAAWRSLLVTDLASPRSFSSMRLVWYARQPRAFDEQSEVASLFARQAGVAMHAVDQREHLREAVEARAHVARALGVLMSRYGLREEQALALALAHSQQNNLKLHALADHILETGELPETIRPPRA